MMHPGVSEAHLYEIIFFRRRNNIKNNPTPNKMAPVTAATTELKFKILESRYGTYVGPANSRKTAAIIRRTLKNFESRSNLMLLISSFSTI